VPAQPQQIETRREPNHQHQFFMGIYFCLKNQTENSFLHREHGVGMGQQMYVEGGAVCAVVLLPAAVAF
jgi:hypothetical protein